MINILKPFEGLATRYKRNEFSRATLKLTLYYVLSTAVILLVSSVAILIIFAPPETEMPFQAESSQIEVEHDEWSLYEVREHLVGVIFMVDVLILLLVSVFAYYFARKTLLPIQVIHEKQRQFMGDAAHELRTPLSVMQAGADTVLRRERSVAEYQLFVSDTQEEIARLTRVSNQLLQLLKTDEEVVERRKEVKVSELLMTEIRRFTPYATSYDITLTDDITPEVTTDTYQDSLIEIVQNLLKNAIDYSRKGDSVNLSLHLTGTSLKIIITDTGIGIEPARQELIFGRFKKVDSARTQTKDSGTGLGLAIVKALVSKLEGQIELTSALGVGTKVTVTLPILHS